MDNIKTPEELLKFMESNIKYGYLGKNKKVYYFDDEDFNKDWLDQYVLENNKDILKNHCGTCWDQVEFERDWFLNHGYEIKTIYEMVLLDYKNNYPTHAYLVYKEDEKWCWFENSDFNNQGIHKFNSFEELIKNQYYKYVSLLKNYNISDEEIDKIIITDYERPKEHISASEYYEHTISSKRINMDDIK